MAEISRGGTELSIVPHCKGPKSQEKYILAAQCTAWSESRATAELAYRWLQACMAKHESCCTARQDASARPSRLLDLSTLDKDGTIRLIYTPHLSSSSTTDDLQYITLSHRWRDSQILRLTRDNHDLFRRTLPVEDLPMTFHHAARITLDLGYKYLWVDSLCILQDSVQDWEHESKIMGEIYRGSICNIAALDAESSLEGCFAARNPLKGLPYHLGIGTGDTDWVSTFQIYKSTRTYTD